MRKHTTSVIAAIAATLLLSIAVGVASANRIAQSEGRFRQVFPELHFGEGTTPGSNDVVCSVTMEGSFHSRTMSKVLEALVGYVSRAIVSSTCTNGSARVFTETLPWHIRYGGFTGRLPEITGINLRLIGSRFSIHSNSLGTTCTSTTSAANPAKGIVHVEQPGGAARTLETEGNAGIPTGFECLFVTGHFIGNSELFVLGSTTRITVTLVA
jgi:hypothetical protein